MDISIRYVKYSIVSALIATTYFSSDTLTYESIGQKTVIALLVMIVARLYDQKNKLNQKAPDWHFEPQLETKTSRDTGTSPESKKKSSPTH